MPDAGCLDRATRVAASEVEGELRRVLPRESFQRMEPLGQFNLGFLICRSGADLFIVDQHAADEKHRFETLQASTETLTLTLTLTLTPNPGRRVVNCVDLTPWPSGPLGNVRARPPTRWIRNPNPNPNPNPCSNPGPGPTLTLALTRTRCWRARRGRSAAR